MTQRKRKRTKPSAAAPPTTRGPVGGARGAARLKRLAKARKEVGGVAEVIVTRRDLPRLTRAAKRARVQIVEVRRPTPPVPIRRGRPPKAKVAKVFTFFKAQGSTFGRLKSPSVNRGVARENPPPGMVTGPAAFYSNEGFALGQVKFTGRVPLKILNRMLTNALDVTDRKGVLRDYRDVYPKWKLKYQVVEVLDGKTRVVERQKQPPRKRGT